MKTQDVQYRFETNPNGTWTIVEFRPDRFPLNYGIEEPSYEHAFQTLRYIKWLEEVYSPPRK